MVFDDGSFLQGWWLDNKPDGKCRNVLADGSVTEGMFKDWMFQGKAICADKSKMNGIIKEISFEMVQEKDEKVKEELSSLQDDSFDMEMEAQQ